MFGQKFGWERANWFAPEGVPQEDDWSFRRSAWFEHIGNECKNVSENVGLLDMSAFAKCRISGPGAEEFLDNCLVWGNKNNIKTAKTMTALRLALVGGLQGIEIKKIVSFIGISEVCSRLEKLRSHIS